MRFAIVLLLILFFLLLFPGLHINYNMGLLLRSDPHLLIITLIVYVKHLSFSGFLTQIEDRGTPLDKILIQTHKASFYFLMRDL